MRTHEGVRTIDDRRRYWRALESRFSGHGRSWRHASDRFLDKLRESKAKQGERVKVIVSGPVVEKYEYEVPVKVGPRPRTFDPETGEIIRGGRLPDVELDEHGNVVKRERKDEVKRTNGRRSKLMLRRLVLANFENRDKFVTLTLRDGAVEDVTNIKQCNREFDKFVKRMRRKYGEFRYCRVIEFQDDVKGIGLVGGRGAVHYHCIMSLPYVPWPELRATWGQGNIDIQAIEHVDNVGAYVSKYMSKDLADDRLAGVKAFATSQNLVRPIVLYGKDAAETMEMIEGKKKVFESAYDSEYQGRICYTEYNSLRE